MVRTQIQLTEEQCVQLKRWASRLGISLAEAVRRCVADRLAAAFRRLLEQEQGYRVSPPSG
jgi:hypothetical protein